MESFTFELEIAAGLDPVFDAFWRLESWPSVAPHVRAIEMHYEDPEIQILTMRVDTRGRQDGFKTVRIRQPESIFYYQPAPPPMLRRHYGWWLFSRRAAGTLIASTHCLEIDVVRAAEVLAGIGVAAGDGDTVRDEVRKILHHNSLQTMRALKQRLEEAGGNDHGSPENAWVV